MKCRNWYGVEWLVRWVGRGNPDVQARNHFHAFFMHKTQGYGHARTTTYRTPYSGRACSSGTDCHLVGQTVALFQTECVRHLWESLDIHWYLAENQRNFGCWFLQGLLQLPHKRKIGKWWVMVLSNNSWQISQG